MYNCNYTATAEPETSKLVADPTTARHWTNVLDHLHFHNLFCKILVFQVHAVQEVSSQELRTLTLLDDSYNSLSYLLCNIGKESGV
jgi:hypothetical protein